MDIEFVELEHRENILKLMQICNLEMKQAYDLYVQSGYNFEAAVSRKFNQINKPPQNAYQYANVPQQANFYPPHQPQFFEHQYLDDDSDYKYAQYKQFIKNGKSFTSKYPVRKRQSFFERIIPSFFKKEVEDSFKKNLEKYIERRLNLKNTVGNLSEVLEWSWKQKYPALIMILDFLPESKADVKKIFSEDIFVEQVLNQQFKLYGINVLQYNLEEQLKHLFNFQRDANHFVVCRVNHLEEIQIMHRIKVSEPYEEIKKKLKFVKSQCIQVEMEEGNIVKQYQQERKGNYNYKRPRTIKENLKFKEDKKIRKQQQQEFFKACVPKKEQQKPANVQQTNIKNIQKKQEIKTEIPSQKQEQISQQELKRIRQQKFSKLQKYSSGLTFKIRVPSGQNIIVSVDGQQLVQYLFDYIASEPRDLGFAHDISRNFDIFVGFGGTQTLKGKQEEQLRSLFQDSEVLIVREITE